MYQKFTLLALSSLLVVSQAALGEDCRVEGTSELKTMPHELNESDLVIMELERQTCRLINAGKIDELMDTYIAEHGVILLDKGGIANGREAQRQMFKEFFAAGYAIVYEPADARTSQAGDMAWAIGAYKLTTPNGTQELGKYTSVWESVDGRWLNVIEMRNPNAK